MDHRGGSSASNRNRPDEEKGEGREQCGERMQVDGLENKKDCAYAQTVYDFQQRVIASINSGLLLVVEKDSIMSFGDMRSKFLDSWKGAITAEGFELVKYQLLTTGTRKAHAFAFRTVGVGENTIRTGDREKGCRQLWIKQDFSRSNDPESAMRIALQENRD